MKMRNGFVSNSSSSSFVIKYKEDDFKKCDVCNHTPLTPHEIALNEEGRYGDTDIKYYTKDKGIVTLVVEADHHGGLYETVFELKDTNKIKIIEEEVW
jgi:hypothetical protein